MRNLELVAMGEKEASPNNGVRRLGLEESKPLRKQVFHVYKVVSTVKGNRSLEGLWSGSNHNKDVRDLGRWDRSLAESTIWWTVRPYTTGNAHALWLLRPPSVHHDITILPCMRTRHRGIYQSRSRHANTAATALITSTLHWVTSSEGKHVPLWYLWAYIVWPSGRLKNVFTFTLICTLTDILPGLETYYILLQLVHIHWMCLLCAVIPLTCCLHGYVLSYGVCLDVSYFYESCLQYISAYFVILLCILFHPFQIIWSDLYPWFVWTFAGESV